MYILGIPSQKQIDFIKSKLIKPGSSKQKKECMFELKNPEDIKGILK